MKETILISDRGQITLPASLRKKYSLDKNTPIVIEETQGGLLLKKASVLPLSLYSNDEIEQWLKEDKPLPRDGKWRK